jgi:hypothetical protein
MLAQILTQYINNICNSTHFIGFHVRSFIDTKTSLWNESYNRLSAHFTKYAIVCHTCSLKFSVQKKTCDESYRAYLCTLFVIYEVFVQWAVFWDNPSNSCRVYIGCITLAWKLATSYHCLVIQNSFAFLLGVGSCNVQADTRFPLCTHFMHLLNERDCYNTNVFFSFISGKPFPSKPQRANPMRRCRVWWRRKGRSHARNTSLRPVWRI